MPQQVLSRHYSQKHHAVLAVSEGLGHEDEGDVPHMTNKEIAMVRAEIKNYKLGCCLWCSHLLGGKAPLHAQPGTTKAWAMSVI